MFQQNSHCRLVSCRPPISVSPASWQVSPDEAEQSRHPPHRQVGGQVGLAAAAACLAGLPSGQVAGVRTRTEPSKIYTNTDRSITWKTISYYSGSLHDTGCQTDSTVLTS